MDNINPNTIYNFKYYKILELDTIMDKVKENLDLKKSIDLIDSFSLYEDKDLIEEKLNETQEAFTLLFRVGKFPIYFSDDVAYPLSKIHKSGSISPLELASIGNFLDTLRDIFSYFNDLEDKKIETVYLNKHLDNITYPKELNLQIRKIVSPYGEIKDDASPELRQIRKEYDNIERSISSKLQEVLQKNASKLTQAVISIRNERYVIPVKSDFKNQVKGIIHDESSSGETVYIEPMVICELNNKMASLKEEEKREIDRILKNIAASIDAYYEELRLSYDELLDLDVTFAKAKYAMSYNGTKPHINTNGILELYNAYHPLLNVNKVIKNNIILGKDYKGIIITGPNTGGKTVLLKTIGLLSLMVKCGMLIPAEENSNINIFENVYADIGDEQSINQNLSTFSSHMINVIDIINNVNNNSLVLLDELGSGTDPVEGSSLAISIFDYLISKNCLLVSTSHYSELKVHAYNSKDIINASVEFDVNTLKPTYRLLIGVPGMSNAIQISKNLGLRQDILDNAKDYVYKKNDNLSLVLDKMVKQSNLLDKKIKEVEDDKIELQNKIKLQDEEINKTVKERNKVIQEANKEKEKIILETREQLFDLLDEISDLKAKGKSSIKEHEIADLKHRVRTLNDNDLQEAINPLDKEKEIIPGSNVYVRPYQAYGTVVNIHPNGKCDVQIGVLSMKVDLDDLVISTNEKEVNVAKKQDNTNKQPINMTRSVSPKLDLRGKRFEEGKELIERYLDDAFCASLKVVTIIHGFGTGTMRKLVQDILSKNKNVKEFRYGDGNEGGFGATVVTFKD